LFRSAIAEGWRVLNCVDLFAGAGGFSLAARKVGFCVRLAIENDKHAIATYRANLCTDESRTHLREGDISKMSPAAIFANTFEAGEQCDLLLGGPPCQGFSTHRINDTGVEDKRNELIHVYFEFVRTFSPSIFLMENVPGMLWPRHATYLDKFYREAAVADYFVFKPVVLDARDFGIPQRRKRVFLLGLRQAIPREVLTWPPQPTHGNETARRKRPELKPWTECSSAFAAAPPGDPNDIHMHHNEDLIRAFRRTPSNGGSRASSGRTLDCHKDHDGHSDVYGRIDPTLPGPTMTTACINPSKGRFVHPVLHHGITVRQAARIQTFPDHFVFKGGLMACGEQVGNAIPVQPGAVLIEYIKPLIFSAREIRATRSEPNTRRAA
jgi:DNA (cytosine-5)-methyltransferase 1